MESIFENINAHLEGKFWTRLEPPVAITPQQELHRGTLFETNESKQLLKKRNYLLTNTSLFFAEEDYSLARKESSIRWMIMEPFIETLGEDTKYGFRLKQGACQKDFYTDSNESLDIWIDKLSSICIMTSIENDYKFVKKIGKGSFADVYLAKDLITSENVAIKAIHKIVCLKSPNGLSSLVNEIEIMRKLDHPNIIKFYKIYESEHHISLVLDFLEGGELFTRVLSKGSYTEKEAARLIWKLLKVLKYLDSNQIIHRDVKLENIMLKSKDKNTSFKLIDFGLACYCEENLTLRCGSPGYIAPEILKKYPYSTKADVFSAGVILYILLSGRSPFPGRNNGEVLARNRDCRLHFEDSYWSAVSAQAIKFVLTLTESNPDLRPTAKEALKSSWFLILKRHERRKNHNKSKFIPIALQNPFQEIKEEENEEEPHHRHGAISSGDTTPVLRNNPRMPINFRKSAINFEDNETYRDKFDF
ncbi:unnamed protein product [Blepharisma stoltei]|uniref:non-specific serine/threonine protein kinase n=1 Tax=Blepharisma stoltei TaxID=1481888 RepID=A0AAU9JCE2_9CILI|nr:unnamed protein product [Blepharisma stoltei]